MNKQEFEKRVGCEVSVDIYAEIEKMYANSPLDKDRFCQKAKKDNLIVKIQQDKIIKLEAVIAQITEQALRIKRTTDGILGDKARQDGENRGRELLVEGSDTYYHYNQAVMSRAENCEAQGILEILDPDNTNDWHR